MKFLFQSRFGKTGSNFKRLKLFFYFLYCSACCSARGLPSLVMKALTQWFTTFISKKNQSISIIQDAFTTLSDTSMSFGSLSVLSCHDTHEQYDMRKSIILGSAIN